MLTLPEYPWDAMAPYLEQAASHPDGPVNLSIGTPVDSTPAVIREALASAADAPGYPTTHGRRELREAVAAWFSRRRGVHDVDPEAVLPTMGSKELVAWLPTLLGMGQDDVVLRPRVAYPTYDIGAQIAGATPLAVEDPAELDEDILARVKLIWLNSPANPTGAVTGVEHMRAWVELARRLGAVVASDECYAELPWEVDEVPSVLDPRVSAGDHRGLLAVYSASKQSNVAGYRAAFAAGCPELIAGLVNTRKHAGMIMPAPVQEALRVALTDDAHVEAQREIYGRRRELLLPALQASGLQVRDSVAGLYLWCTDGVSDSWTLVEKMASRGIVVGPGVFYGEHGDGFIRVALTAPDERIAAAAERLG
ncbi:succinyldiaminopimelate transaminase [Nesterenkonia sp. HG001]|uniref:succinyldiaminopimelate transaminase n=1 Tax=Nesterenkonia sp. HG001 TaxID=2983207 RepID=UPI002AC62C7E|nr:succinyldiaminopimelate transaminase [Nesterenkonia sp. HG001]MDZ5076203.1 succinyldiaminopimelate transaminase [Nesterenkonia sp. HG001]